MTEGDPVIDALRGVAACMIMITHYAHMVTSDIGLWSFAGTRVDLFFVLSGYVFAPYLLGKSLPVNTYYIRRFFRLVPLYWFAIACYVALTVLAGKEVLYLWQHMFFLHTMQSTEIAFFYNPALWSLPPEIEFCLVLPLLARWIARFGLRSLLVLSIMMRLALVFAGDPQNADVTARSIALVHLPGFLCEIMLGTMAYSLAKRSPATEQRVTRFLLGAVLLVVVVWLYQVFLAGHAKDKPTSIVFFLGGNVGLIAAIAYMAIVSALAGDGVVSLPWWGRIFQRIGLLSYGVFLFHNAIPETMRLIGFTVQGWGWLVASVMLTLGWAWLAYHLLEHPARELGRKLSRRSRDNKLRRA